MVVNRKQRRFSESYHKKEVKKSIASNKWTPFEDRTAEAKGNFPGDALLGFYVNNLFSVQCFEVLGTKVYGVRRNDQSTNISWEAKQRIKNEVIGEEVSAIEVYPKCSQLVDQANMYWLWITDCECFNLETLRFNINKELK
jgi:hypothetical protein